MKKTSCIIHSSSPACVCVCVVCMGSVLCCWDTDRNKQTEPKLGPDTAPVIRVTQIYFSRKCTPPQRPSRVVRGSVFITSNELSWQISRATQKLIMAEFMCLYFKLVELISPLKMQVPRLPLRAAIILSACLQIRSNSPARTHTSGRPCGN